MYTTVTDKVVFENTTPSKIYDMYTNAQIHAAFSGAPAEVTDKVGDNMIVFGGYIKGKNVHLVPNELIVQTWKAEGMDMKEDSIVSMRLVEAGRDTHLYLTHADIPEGKGDAMLQGWDEWYWSKMKAYLQD